MTEAPVAIQFFDRERDVHGVARSGFTVLFRGRAATSVPHGPEVERDGEGWRAHIDGSLDLTFTPDGPAADLGSSTALPCRVAGTVDEVAIDALGVVTETSSPPRWDELDAVRNVLALFGPGHGLIASARRPRGAVGHGEELVVAQLLADGEALHVEDARLSTVYDGEARPRSAGFELRMPGEEFPRRAFGHAIAGVSLALEGLEAHVAVFSWRMAGAEGLGVYELTARAPAPSAA